MIKIDPVLKLLKKEKEMSFEDIFNNVKNDITFKYETEAELKADLFVSMLDTKLFIMIGNNKWGFRENYSIEEIANIEKVNQGQISEEEFELEASEETKEMNISEVESI